jgi:hypothetical protein
LIRKTAKKGKERIKFHRKSKSEQQGKGSVQITKHGYHPE